MSNKEENNELRVISIEELKEFEGLAELSDSESLKIIETLKQLAVATHQIISKHE
ncbi:hypothetical protein GCM10022393_28290 [Aquimarina addita]|uniref:Uncharacterized protein n=1 Tax=Aquimarina addita TaxID=870485 RepID=A0ABP6UME4_9FLAO